MKLHFDKLISYTTPPEIPTEPLSPEAQKRITEQVFRQIGAAPKQRQNRRVLRYVGLAAAITVLLCGSVFAAYETNWFGLGALLKAEDSADYIVSYAPETAAPAAVESLSPEGAPLEETAPERWEIAQNTENKLYTDWAALYPVSETYSVELTDYRVSLESLAADARNTLAVVKLDPLSDFGRENLGMEPGFDQKFILSCNNARVPMLGGMRTELLGVEDGAAYYLTQTTGTENRVGDSIFFELQSIPTESGYERADLFTVELTELIPEEKTVTLPCGSTSATLTVTPLSLSIEGSSQWNRAMSNEADYQPHVTVTLTDGTSFSLWHFEGGDFTPTKYGSYGTLSIGGCYDEETDTTLRTWVFSRLVTLEDIETITVDGTAYSLK